MRVRQLPSTFCATEQATRQRKVMTVSNPRVKYARLMLNTEFLPRDLSVYIGVIRSQRLVTIDSLRYIKCMYVCILNDLSVL